MVSPLMFVDVLPQAEAVPLATQWQELDALRHVLSLLAFTSRAEGAEGTAGGRAASNGSVSAVTRSPCLRVR